MKINWGGVLAAVGCVWLFCGAAHAGQALGPGVYGPFDNGMQQWTYSLSPVHTSVLGPSGGMGGAAISSDGLFLTEFYDIHTATFGPKLYALGNTGQIVRSLSLPDGLYRGTGIVVTPGTGDILTGLGSHILKISNDFSQTTTLPLTFGRVAGMALANDGTLYVVDQDNNRIDVINSAYQIVSTIPTHQTPIGLALGPGNALYYTDEPYQGGGAFLSRMVKVDLANNDAQTVVLSGLPFMADLTFSPDGTFYLGISGGNALTHYSADYQLLQQVSPPGLNDGIAVVVGPVAPLPSALPAGLGLLGVLAMRPLLRRKA